MSFKGKHGSEAPGNGVFKIAILAVGGQGGGVLSNWIIDIAEKNHFWAQSTSVPGVAQRTGATIYYVEFADKQLFDRAPTLALMPSPEDVDVVIASEIIEAGRALTRNFIDPNRTTTIVSNHRIYAVSEKIVPGDGRINTDDIESMVREKSKQAIIHDFQKVAADRNSHISASLLGALAGSGCLPFSKASYEESIVSSGKGVERSLKAFNDAYRLASESSRDCDVTQNRNNHLPHFPEIYSRWLSNSLDLRSVPSAIQWTIFNGLNKVVDYQDEHYGYEYLGHLSRAMVVEQNASGSGSEFRFLDEFAKHVANAMCYGDVIYVADIKTRASRFANIIGSREDAANALVTITDYFHPTVEEVIGTLPRSLGDYVQNSVLTKNFIRKRFSSGKKVRVTGLLGFLQLYVLAGLKRWRRKLHRHEVEQVALTSWLGDVYSLAEENYELAIILVRARRLHKGYSDTLNRGKNKYYQVTSFIHKAKTLTESVNLSQQALEFALKAENPKDLELKLKSLVVG